MLTIPRLQEMRHRTIGRLAIRGPGCRAAPPLRQPAYAAQDGHRLTAMVVAEAAQLLLSLASATTLVSSAHTSR